MSTTCPPVHPSGGVPTRRAAAVPDVAVAAPAVMRPHCRRHTVVEVQRAREYGQIDRFTHDCVHRGRSGYRGRFSL